MNKPTNEGGKHLVSCFLKEKYFYLENNHIFIFNPFSQILIITSFLNFFIYLFWFFIYLFWFQNKEQIKEQASNTADDAKFLAKDAKNKASDFADVSFASNFETKFFVCGFLVNKSHSFLFQNIQNVKDKAQDLAQDAKEKASDFAEVCKKRL